MRALMGVVQLRLCLVVVCQMQRHQTFATPVSHHCLCDNLLFLSVLNSQSTCDAGILPPYLDQRCCQLSWRTNLQLGFSLKLERAVSLRQNLQMAMCIGGAGNRGCSTGRMTFIGCTAACKLLNFIVVLHWICWSSTHCLLQGYSEDCVSTRMPAGS